MLNSYLNLTQRLLQNPGAPVTLYSPGDLTSYINIGRGQLAGEGECIRIIGTISTVAGQQQYPFSSIALGAAGVSGVIHVRRIAYLIAGGQRWIAPRAWPWFDLFYMNNPVPQQGLPKNWAQYGQGASGQGLITGIGAGSMASGSFFIDPPPDMAYTLKLDCVCYPNALASDTDVEAIPYLWTDAVPFFAAYYALLGTQANARAADAQRMFGLYQQYAQRARQYANPSPGRFLYAQSGDVVQISKLGVSPGGRQQAQPQGGGG